MEGLAFKMESFEYLSCLKSVDLQRHEWHVVLGQLLELARVQVLLHSQLVQSLLPGSYLGLGEDFERLVFW